MTESLAAMAAEAALTRAGVQALLERAAREGLDLAIALDAAIDAGDGRAATALAFAAAAAGAPPTAGQVGRLLPLVATMDHALALLQRARGDRVGMAVDAARRGAVTVERVAAAFVVATEALGALPPPPELLAEMRLLAREPLEPEAGTLLGIAASRIKDPDLRRVADRWIRLAPPLVERTVLGRMRDLATRPALEVLGDVEAPDVPGGDFTVRRAAPKVGRNDPCPCGSGKKVKHCCEGELKKRLADPSPVAGVTMAEYRAKPQIHARVEDFALLRPAEIAAIDPRELDTLRLIEAIRKLALFHMWPAAERALDALASRPDLPEGEPDADGWREEVFLEALRAGEAAAARRQLDLMRAPESAPPAWRLELELLEGCPDALARIEALALDGVREDDPVTAIELALTLLNRAPALGILVARGALDEDRTADSDHLLDEIDRVRDRLGLPAGDRADEILAALEDAPLPAGPAEGDEKARAEAQLLERRLAEARAQIAGLEGRLAEGEERLRAAREEPAPASEAAAPAPELEEDVKRLRSRVGELKSIIDVGRRERQELRDRLRAEAQERAAQASVPARDAGEGPEAAEAEGGVSPAGALLMPAFSRPAEDELRRAPESVQRSALRVAAALGGGEQGAWREVKRLQAVEGVLSARVGIHYRLLFRVDREGGRLIVAGFTHRQSLETAIKRLPR